MAAEARQNFRARSQRVRRVPGSHQVVADELGDVAIVFDDEDVAHGSGSILAVPARPVNSRTAP
jgi:sorbitol-specific phosphotransferase system component IIA